MNSTSILIRVTAPAQFTEYMVGGPILGRIEDIVSGVSDKTDRQQNVAVAVITNCAAKCAAFGDGEEVAIDRDRGRFQGIPNPECLLDHPQEKAWRLFSYNEKFEDLDDNDVAKIKKDLGHPLLRLIYPNCKGLNEPGNYFIVRAESMRKAGVPVF